MPSRIQNRNIFSLVRFVAVGVVGIFFTAAPAFAGPVNLNFSTDVTYSPGTIVAAGGTSLGGVLQQSFGIDSSASNTFTITGTLTYDSDTAPQQAGPVTSGGVTGSAAGYRNAITGLTLSVAGIPVAADISAINANSGSATSGFLVAPTTFALINPEIGGASYQQFQAIYPSTVQTGNSAIIVNETQVQVNGPSGSTTFATTDSIGFSLGTTAIDDFGSNFSTSAGSLAVSSFAMILVGNGSKNLLSDTSLPIDSSFFNPDVLDTSLIALVLKLDGGFLPIQLSGKITSFAITPSAVPVPAGIGLFGSALGLLVAARCQRSKASTAT